jgi:DNA end-binding protein Ku
MARAIWTGALTFGLVNIPVRLHTAVAQKEVRFHMLHAKDGARIRLKRFCSAEEQEVPYDEIVKGFEVSRGRHVTLTEDELQALDPKASRTIEIRDFVDLAEIDPIYYERTYYLLPEKTAAKAYRLLLEAMRASGKVALGTFVLRTRESLCCIRPIEDALALSTMNRADEVVPLSSLELPEAAEPSDRELQMAGQLVESLSAPFEPGRYPDVHRERVLELVERKAEGEVIEAPAPEAAPAEVVSLADALSASLAAARRRGDEGEPRRSASAHGEPAPMKGARDHRASAARTAGKTRRKRR